MACRLFPHPESLIQNAPNEIGLCSELVMPGLVPGIHVFASFEQGKTWMAGTSPAKTKNESFSICWEESEILAAFSASL
jgi:hypothetical protein